MAQKTREVEIIPPVTSSQVFQWKSKITASWKSAAEGILQVAKDLYDAREALKNIDKRLWAELQNQLDDEKIISLSIQKKLMVIGGKHAMLEQFSGSLPPRYNAIYRLSDLSGKQLQKFVDADKITPTIEDKEINLLLSSGKPPAPPTNEDIVLARVVQSNKRLSSQSRTKFKNLMAELAQISGLEVRQTTDGKKITGNIKP